jgi:hypothetical protein
MSKLVVEEVDAFPPLVRGGAAKNSEEREQIKVLLSQVEKKHKVKEIKDKNAYNSLQQRIRGIARSMNLKVSIQWSEKENALYFRSEPETPVEETPKSPVRTNTKK